MLPPPTDLGASPRELLAQLVGHLGEPEAARYCADLLAGADADACRDRLVYVGGRPAETLTTGSRDWVSWPPVWGARGLLYVWDDSCAPTVVAGVRAEAWRVAEMSTKVVARRELGDAGDAVVRLVHHELSRVRAAAVRALGVVGEQEHLPAVLDHLDDEDGEVRTATARALARMEQRLDLDLRRWHEV